MRMLRMTKIEQFVDRLSQVNLPNVFNPYSDICEIYDHANSPSERRNNLIAQLEKSVALHVDTIWFGRDLGYRGGRRTGVALTDEMHLPLLAHRCKDERIKKATAGPLMPERTANVIWSVISELPHVPFLWNAFPFHPHDAEDQFTNRCHTKSERLTIWHLNIELIELLNPKIVVAIGNDAHNALDKLDLECLYVRHPSYGGQADFLSGIRKIYNLDTASNRQSSTQSSFALL